LVCLVLGFFLMFVVCCCFLCGWLGFFFGLVFCSFCLLRVVAVVIVFFDWFWCWVVVLFFLFGWGLVCCVLC